MTTTYLDHQAILRLKELIRRANTEICPTTREMYRQLAIKQGTALGIQLQHSHFAADPPSAPGGEPETIPPEPEPPEKVPIPDRLPEYPGKCPVCERVCANQLSWNGHKKMHH